MSAHSRNKGSAFERDIAQKLNAITGVSFKRDLDQVREGGLGDLLPDDPAWPFIIECKRYASGNSCRPDWKAQASTAATKARKWPAVVFRFDRQETRVAIPLAAIWAAVGGTLESDEWIEITIGAFAMVAAELMQGKHDVGH